MLYRVTRQYTRGTDTPAAQFVDSNDARLFIQTKLAEDARLKVNVTYRIYEGSEMIEEFPPGSQEGSAGSAGGGQQRGSTQSFQPTPFNAAPRPSGIPQNWVKDQDAGKKEDDKK
jgi:hypothetical protein